ETYCRVAVGVLGGLLRARLQHHPPRLRHDRGGGPGRARRAAGLSLRTRRLGDLCRLRGGWHPRVLSGRLRAGPAVPPGPPDRLEEGLAAATDLAVLIRWSRSPSSTSRPSPPTPPARSRCATRSISRNSATASASPATGWPSTTICPRSR